MAAEEIGVAVKELQAEARRLGLTWDLRPATIIDNRVTLTGIIDGDLTVVTELTSLVGRPEAGARVMVMSVPPSGNYVVGYMSSNQPAIGQTLIRVVEEDITITSSDDPDNRPLATFEHLPAHARFKILSWLWWTSTSGTPDIRFETEGPSDATGETSLFAQDTGATVTAGSINTGVATPLATNHTRGAINGALSGLLAGHYQTDDTVGDLEVRVAQGTSSGTATVLKEGSWVELTRMP